MIAIFFPYLLVSRIDLHESSKIAIIDICPFRMAEAGSDLFQGLFQRHERLDIAGKSMTIRYSISAILLLSILLITR